MNNVGILNFHFANNFGAVLVPFAMMNIIKKLGYKPEIINYVPKKTPRRKNFVEFRRKFLNIDKSHPVLTTHDELTDAQRWYDRIVVGSDQVWRLFDSATYMLDFVSGNRSLVSYAASFGGNKFAKLPNEKAARLLNRFDAISVREESGVTICNEQFGLPAMQVLDPTMLLDVSEYTPIINYFNANPVSNDYIAYSIINKSNTENLQGNLDLLKGAFNLEFKNILLSIDLSEVNSVGGWLNDIKNAKLVITDSFHATVFSILFRKDFVCVVSDSNGTERIPSLLKMMGIDSSERIVTSLTDIDSAIFNKHIDYESVSVNLQRHREKSILFLKNALNKEICYKLPPTKD